MEPTAQAGLRGSFDDVPDAALRTVLAIPLTVPPLPRPAEQEAAPAATDLRPRRSRTSGHRRDTARPAPRSELAATLRIGLSAAVTVFVAVALAMMAVQAFIR